MKLLPSEQTLAQRAALRDLINRGELTLQEPGGKRVVKIRMDAGTIWRLESEPWIPVGSWEEVTFAQAIEEVARLTAEGWKEMT